MAEEQALSRIHRMGQTNQVKTIRYIMKDSIEEVGHVIIVFVQRVSLTINRISANCSSES
jgi:SNF2 family DNA or RNA helicase